jgi:hypothetical protein
MAKGQTKDFITFIEDASNDPNLLEEFVNCSSPDKIKELFDKRGYQIYKKGDFDRIYEIKGSIGMNEWPLPPYY